MSILHLDSCAFDPKYYPEDEAANEIFQIYERFEVNGLILQFAHSTQKEIDHPNTPTWVKKRASMMTFTLSVGLSLEEQDKIRAIELIIAGNGEVDQIKEDANHIFEAQKYASYFVTTDKRLLRKRNDIKKLCSLNIVSPSVILEELKKYQNSGDAHQNIKI